MDTLQSVSGIYIYVSVSIAFLLISMTALIVLLKILNTLNQIEAIFNRVLTFDRGGVKVKSYGKDN